MTPRLNGSHRLIVVVGASGVGKDTVISAWLAALPAGQRPHRAQRVITRPAGDDSEPHEAVELTAFLALQAAGALALVWTAHGLHYGIRSTELAPLARGQWVVMNGSRAHLAELRALAPDAQVVEVVADAATRLARLQARGREPPGPRLDRLRRCVAEPAADFRLHNDGDLRAAVRQLDAWFQPLRLKGEQTA
jgi:ribose 1,5-bisphosphokinase